MPSHIRHRIWAIFFSPSQLPCPAPWEGGGRRVGARAGAVVDRSYPLAEAAEAIRYLEQGHAAGKVVVSV